MNEVELKILEISIPAVEKKLRKLHAKKIFSGILETSYFDFPGNKLRRKSRVLRLRVIEGKTFLTFKMRMPVKKAVSSEETEFEVGNFKKASHFLHRLGLKTTFSYRKKRVSYRMKKVRIELEQYLGKFSRIKPFLEIEAQNEKDAYNAVGALGFSEKDAKVWHSGQLFKYYKMKVFE
ncbi:MAG: CYTH domain-containing protein [Candidatus ainarchaeum sp.]|nr:CYTH domain-containing protein [Candidatus ainarchaeum sp.]